MEENATMNTALAKKHADEVKKLRHELARLYNAGVLHRMGITKITEKKIQTMPEDQLAAFNAVFSSTPEFNDELIMSMPSSINTPPWGHLTFTTAKFIARRHLQDFIERPDEPANKRPQTSGGGKKAAETRK